MSVPATRDMVAMDYLAQVQLLCVIVIHVNYYFNQCILFLFRNVALDRDIIY